jgi:chromosome segregation protein
MAVIKSMKLKGFKSFAKPLDLEFGTGFNCVIGPNGSGKSNIMDALCFVLGKLSAKSMRAERSSNLIFNGGKKGSPLKDAEVSIVFSNENKEFPIETDEVKLSRIIKSNGTSTYKINDQTLTRQQIIEALSKARIDPDGHNIILQGDIVRFMEMRPDRRRELIEEIAGISIFEDKKAKALNALNKVESQLNDATLILREREVYLRELKKDKDQAEKYRNLEKNIKSNKATYINSQIKDKQLKLDEVKSKISKQEQRIKKLNETIDQIRKKIEKRKQELKDINANIEEKGEKEAISLQDDVEKIKTDLATNTERLSTCRNEVSKLTERKRQLITSEQDTEKTIKELENSKKELLREIEILKEKESKQSTQVKQLKSKLGFTENTELDNIENQLDKKTESYDSLQTKNQELLREKFNLDAQTSSLNEKISSVEKLEKSIDSKKTKSEFEKISKELIKSLNEDTVLYSQLKKVREEYAALNENLFKAQTQQSGIKATTEADRAVKNILNLKKPNIYGTVAQLGKVDKKFSTALEVAAGPRIKSLVVKDDKIAAECIRHLKATKAGIATFLPMNKIRPRPTTKLRGQGVYGSAIDLIDFDNKFKDIFSYVFANTLIVENINIARRVGIGKVRMVTLEGDLVEISGAMIGGYRFKRVGLSFQEKSLSSSITKIGQEIDQKKRLKELLESRKVENEDRINSLRERKSQLEAEIIKIERTSSGMSLTELKKQRDNIKSSNVYSEYSEVGKELQIINSEIQKLKISREKLRGKSSSSSQGQTELDTVENKRLTTREDIAKKNTEIKNIDLQIMNIYLPEKEKINKLAKGCDKEAEDFKSELKTLESLIRTQQTLLKQKESDKAKFQQAYKGLFSTRNKMSEDIQKLETSTLIEAEKEKTINDKINNYSIDRAKITAELEALNLEFEDFKGIPLRRGIDISQLKHEIRNFETMIEKMGNVNMRALEIYEEAKKEHDRLTEQTGKLGQEREDVLNLIAEIETNKKSIFMKTFKELNKNFGRIFLTLSRKGEANLELEDKEDPLSAGIDIRVRLIGNKFLDIKSLSGGEKTMAALALIFAIQEYQPAAFYLLDEVDAALDKKNSELLSELIAKYSGTAQYIMISHNDHVISEADYVYGVSMHETGISKVVSLKL